MSSEEEKTTAITVVESDEIEEEACDSRLTAVTTMDISNPVESLKAMFELYTPSGDEHAMIALVSKFLTEQSIDFMTDCAGNMYFKNHIEGSNRFIVNAHMDTVADGVAELEVIESTPKKTLIQSTNSQVIGADDKCGVYAVLKLISDKDLSIPLTGLLCVSEECGLVGSSYAMQHHSDYFDDCIFCITVDRRGNEDIITMNSDLKLSSDEVIGKLDEFGEAFGYKHATGSISDVSNIVQTLNINGINMAAGYYGAHTGSEKVVVEELLDSIVWLRDVMMPRMRTYLIGNPDAMVYKPTAAIRIYGYGSYGLSGYGGYTEHYGKKWTYNSGREIYGGYGTKDVSSSEESEGTKELEEVLDCWMKVLDDAEMMNGWYMLDSLEEDATYKISGSGKSLVVIGGWTTYGEELGIVANCLDIGYGDGSGDATVLIADIEKYIDDLEAKGFSASFDEDGEWL